MINSTVTDPSAATSIMEFVSPRSINFLCDNGEAQKLIADLRWRNGLYCPRCLSKFAKKIVSNIYQYFYRCIDCGYLYNQMAMTVFHGAKVQASQILQLFVIYTALGDRLSARDVSFALNLSHRTAGIFLKRLHATPILDQFSIEDSDLAEDYRLHGEKVGDPDLERFLSFCEMNSIVVDEQRFKNFIKRLVDTDETAT